MWTQEEEKEGMDLLDEVFYQIPESYRKIMRNDGTYKKILNNEIKDPSALYQILPERVLRFQTQDYSKLADGLMSILEDNSVLQIGSGNGSLLTELDKRGMKELVGIDLSQNMIKMAEEQKVSNQISYYNANALLFDYSKFQHIKTVMFINFWGILTVQDSMDILLKIRNELPNLKQVLIGNFEKVSVPAQRARGIQILREKFGFRTSYPLFLNFALCGFSFEKTFIDHKKYFLLIPS